MMAIKIIAPIVPVTFKRPEQSKDKRGNVHRYNPADFAAFKEELGYLALREMRGKAPLGGALKLYAEVYTKYEPSTLNAGDWDNHGKAIGDALNHICYVDDRQIIDGHIRLFKGEPHINICLEELQ